MPNSMADPDARPADAQGNPPRSISHPVNIIPAPTRKDHLTTLPYAPKIFDNETLFSIGSRFARAMGIESTLKTNRILFNVTQNHNKSHIPRGIHWLARRLPNSLGLTDTHLLTEHTLFSYHSAFSTEAYRAKMAQAAFSGDDRTEFTLVRNANVTRLNRNMAFCPDCHAETQRDLGDVFWDRRHQLPLSFHCHIHGTPLRNSVIAISAEMSSATAANAKTCGLNAPDLIETVDADLSQRLRSLGLRSIALLEAHHRPSAEGIRNTYLNALWSKGFAKSQKQLDRGLIQERLTRYLTQYSIGGRSLLNDGILQPWAARFLKENSNVRDTARHILFQDFLDTQAQIGPNISHAAKEKRKAKDIAQSLHLRCENPALPVDHSHKTEIVSAKHEIGIIHIRVRCSCGYTYSISRFEDGSTSAPRIYDFGPSLGAAIDYIAASGMTRLDLCLTLGMDARTLRYQAEQNGFGPAFASLRKGRRGRKRL